MPRKEIECRLTESGCIEVISHSCCTNGYPQFSIDGRLWMAHRYMFTQINGPIPNGLNVLHSCDNPKCINPAHLRLGTQQDNVRDTVIRNRQARGDTNGMSKLNSKMVRGIMDDAHRLNPSQLSDKYGISKRTVYRIQSGDTWRHITKPIPKQ